MEGLLLVVVILLLGEVLSESAVKYKQYVLDEHNNYRSMQKAKNIQKLEWNETLASIADNWIGHCDFAHEEKGFGENLYFETATEADDLTNSFNKSFTAWYDEINLYRKANQKSCGPSGSCHYTQMVWYRTREVGCAVRVCPTFTFLGKSATNMLYIGCWYSPQGNMANVSPFEAGTACADCYKGQHCEKGLCAGEGEEECKDQDDNCIMYKEMDQCESNKNWMDMNCRQTCEICKGGEKAPCKDKDEVNCPKYVKNLKPGQIKQTCNTPYMKSDCRQSCNFC